MPAKAGSEFNASPEPGILLSLIDLRSLASIAAATAGSKQPAIARGAADAASEAPRPKLSDTRPAAIEFLNMCSVPRQSGDRRHLWYQG